MSLHDIVQHSDLSTQCKYDLGRLGNEYDENVSGSIQRSRLERSTSKAKRTKSVDICKPLTRPVPQGNYATSPVFTRTLPRNNCTLNEPQTGNDESFPQKKLKSSTILPNINRPNEENEYILKAENYRHSSNVRKGVQEREGTDAHRAYTQAFLSYTGRNPTEAELRSVDRYKFLNDPETGRDVIVEEKTITKLAAAEGKADYYYLKRLPSSESKKYPAFRNTMAPKMI